MKSQHFPSKAGFNFKFQMPKLYCYNKTKAKTHAAGRHETTENHQNRT